MTLTIACSHTSYTYPQGYGEIFCGASTIRGFDGQPSPNTHWPAFSIAPLDDVSEVLVRPHLCPFPGCLQRFKRKYTLKDHFKSHTGEKPFVCPVRSCRKTFTTSGNLSRHKRLHPWLTKPLSCLFDGCGCEFPTEEKLERHMLSHFGVPSVHCCEVEACGRVFSTPGNLRRHVKHCHLQRLQKISQPPAIARVKSEPTMVTVGIPPRLAQVIPCRNHQVHENGSYQKRPSYSPVSAKLPSDEELLETLGCLFDEEDPNAKALQMRYSIVV